MVTFVNSTISKFT